MLTADSDGNFLCISGSRRKQIVIYQAMAEQNCVGVFCCGKHHVINVVSGIDRSIISGSHVDLVIARTTKHGVCTATTCDYIIAAITFKCIVTGKPDELVIVRATLGNDGTANCL